MATPSHTIQSVGWIMTIKKLYYFPKGVCFDKAERCSISVLVLTVIIPFSDQYKNMGNFKINNLHSF